MPNTTHSSARTAHRSLPTALLCACMALCLFSIAPEAHAGRKKGAQKTGSTKTKHYPSSSEESRAERDRRLYRECRGLPNAGACLGYTRR